MKVLFLNNSRLDSLLSDLSELFTNGDFDFALSSGPLGQVIKESHVTVGHGIYVVYGRKSGQEYPIYIGKAGTIRQDGSVSAQGVAKRLSMVRARSPDGRKIYGKDFFPMVLRGELGDSGGYDALRYIWVETYRDKKGIPPFLAESQLLAAYLAEQGKLPPFNIEA